MNYYKCVCKFIDMYVFIWPRLESGPPGEPGDTDHDHQVSAQTIAAVPGVAINKIRHLNNSRPDPTHRPGDRTIPCAPPPRSQHYNVLDNLFLLPGYRLPAVTVEYRHTSPLNFTYITITSNTGRAASNNIITITTYFNL